MRKESRWEHQTQPDGTVVPWWDNNGPEHDKKHNGKIAGMLTGLQQLFIERLEAWKLYMAPQGWKRQSRWNQRGWMKLILHALRANAAGRTARHRAIRKIDVGASASASLCEYRHRLSLCGCRRADLLVLPRGDWISLYRASDVSAPWLCGLCHVLCCREFPLLYRSVYSF